MALVVLALDFCYTGGSVRVEGGGVNVSPKWLPGANYLGSKVSRHEQ